MVTVSNNSQLLAALKSAGSGSTIQLTSGTYSLSTRGGDFHNAVITEAAGANVTFSRVELRDASHLTFDGVNFKLPGGQKGVVIADSSDITIRDSNISGPTVVGTKGIYVNHSDDFALVNNNLTGFATAIQLSNIDGLTVQSNTISGTSWDAIMAGGVHNALFADNDISLNTPAGRKHTDGMQFTDGGGSPLSRVTIRDNTIETHDSSSHGMYLGNGGTGTISTSSFFRNILIEDNTVISGQVLGIAVGQTTGLTIRDNTILQDTQFRSTSEGRIPVIRVHADSTDVSITGNTTHKQPTPSGANWQPTNQPEPTWTITNNKIVPLGTTAGQASNTLASADLQASAAPEASSNESADIFRFDAAGDTDVVRGLDFSQGDSIVLHDYARGTFHAQAGGNPLTVSADGTSVTIDHLDDLRELDAASTAVSIREGNDDTLVLDISQPAGAHMVQVLGLAHAYF